MTTQETLQRFHDLLGEFARRTGLDTLEPDEDHGCRIMIDGRLPLDIDTVPETGALYLHAPLCEVPKDPAPGFYRDFLEASLFGSQALGAHFGIDADTDEVILFREMPLHATDAERFENEITDFIAALDAWKERLTPEPHYNAREETGNQAILA